MDRNRAKTIVITFIVVLAVILIARQFLSTTTVKENPKKFSVNVKSFEVKENSSIDDTEFIQNAINYVSQKGGGEVVFPKGVYLIDALKSIELRDNIKLKFEDGVTLKAIPNSANGYEIVKVQNVKNVSMIGNVTIIGDRKEHKGESGEWGMGISINGSENIHIENPIIKDCWGDGIYIGSTTKKGYSKNITIINPVCENNRRQGISVISAKGLHIKNPKLLNTNGTPPQFGIDFEPNEKSEVLQDINLENPVTQGNKGGGVLLSLQSFQGSNKPIDIKIINTKGIRDGLIMKGEKNIKGKISLENY